jgi:hypothetical protein
MYYYRLFIEFPLCEHALKVKLLPAQGATLDQQFGEGLYCNRKKITAKKQKKEGNKR